MPVIERADNLVPACAPCNLSKNDRLLTECRPARVAYGVARSPIVAAEYRRLTGHAPALAAVPS